MGFTVAPRGVPMFPAKPRSGSVPARRPEVRRGWTSDRVYEVVEEVTAGGEWALRREQDGTWAAVRLPSEAVARGGFRTRGACRSYVASGRATEDLERLTAKEGGSRG